MKPLFQRQCEALVAALTKAKAVDGARLSMSSWVSSLHSCGTAACVCGYQALTEDLSLFDVAAEYAGDYESVATNISEDLENSCHQLFGYTYLAASIYAGTDKSRIYFALNAMVADKETLETFKHLTSENPSLDDAITYIEFVIEKCREEAA